MHSTKKMLHNGVLQLLVSVQHIRITKVQGCKHTQSPSQREIFQY